MLEMVRFTDLRRKFTFVSRYIVSNIFASVKTDLFIYLLVDALYFYYLDGDQ